MQRQKKARKDGGFICGWNILQESRAGSSPKLIWNTPISFFFLNNPLFKNFFYKFYLFIYLSVYLPLAALGPHFCVRVSVVAVSGGHSSLHRAGLSLRQPLLLWSTGSRHVGLSSCRLQAQ